MQRNLLFICFVLTLQTNLLSAQTCSQIASNKTLDLREVLYSRVSVVTRSYKSVSSSKTVGDVKYAEDICDVPVNNCDYSGNQLTYDVYYPAGINYKTCSLPAVFLFHGGGFRECVGNETDQMVTLATEFAKRGFVVFNVEYRNGILLSLDFNFYTAQQMLATYRAAQDARGAIRSAIKRQYERKTNKEPYSIDTSNIFIGGMSAGSVTAMSVAYYQQQQMFDKTIPGIKKALGNVNADYYYGDKTISFSIKGVMNLWGGNIVPNKDSANPANFFGANTYMPSMIAFAGEMDSTFAYTKQPVNLVDDNARFPLTQTPLSYEDRCTLNGATFQVHSSYPTPSGIIIGAKNMYNTLRTMRVPAELYLDTKMQHGLSPQSGNDEDKYFGLSVSGIDITLSYIAQRGATFFQAIMNNYAGKLNASVFEDCENNRYADNLKNNTCKTITTLSALASTTNETALTQSTNLEKASVVMLYPNPVKEILQVQISHVSSAVILTILDAGGRVLMYRQLTGANGYNNHISIPVGHFSKGIYYLKTTTGNGITVNKWMKE